PKREMPSAGYVDAFLRPPGTTEHDSAGALRHLPKCSESCVLLFSFVLYLSISFLKTQPSCMTKRTFSSSLMSFSGSPVTRSHPRMLRAPRLQSPPSCPAFPPRGT